MAPEARVDAPYAYEPITERPGFWWPDGAAVAVCVVINVEYFAFNSPGPVVNERATAATPDVLNSSWRDYGTRVGFWRLLDVFDAAAVPVTAALNSDVCRHHPQMVEAGMARGWEWVAHGTTNSQRLTGLSRSQEEQLIGESVDTIEKFTGVRPRGWLGPGLAETPDTLSILAELGLSYVCDYVADDLPFALTSPHGRLLAMPYSIELNDMELLLRQRRTGPQYRGCLTDHFATLVREARRRRQGRAMTIPLHPFLTGQARYARYLQDVLSALSGHGDVWCATAGQIVSYFDSDVLAAGPDADRESTGTPAAREAQ